MNVETTRTSPVVVNCDATRQPDQNDVLVQLISYVVQNHNGRAIEHNGRSLGAGDDSVHAEVQAMKEAVMYVEREPGIDHAVFRTDCDVAVGYAEDWCRGYEPNLDYWSFESVPRTENWLADHFAKHYMDAIDPIGTNTQSAYGMTD